MSCCTLVFTIILLGCIPHVLGFAATTTHKMRHTHPFIMGTKEDSDPIDASFHSKQDHKINRNVDRKDFLQLSIASIFGVGWVQLDPPLLAHATTDSETTIVSSLSPLQLPLYYILRVREATEQETRLVSSGKFKDVQRANVKLAVRFMVQNYKLSDNIIAAASFLTDSNQRVAATDVGQRALENLFTILEYFDSKDVDNLRVGTYDSMAGKEPLVLKGLESVRKNLDDFLSFFRSEDVATVQKVIEEENVLNAREFDPSLGTILNPNPRK